MNSGFRSIRPLDCTPKPDHPSTYLPTRISCYENEVPDFCAAEIDRLHGHLLCSFSNFQMSQAIEGASTYVEWTNDIVSNILLFKRTTHEVVVINEFIKLNEETATRFSNYIFKKFKSVRIISFGKVEASLRALPFPHHVVNCTEDFVVTLPATVSEYHTLVGKNMRRNIKRYTSSLEKDFPSYRYEVFVGSKISEQQIRDIVDLNRARMAGKNIESRIDDAETRWIIDLAKKCGIVGVATIDGIVRGGAIGFRIGQNYFMHVIAHDPEYNNYSLGIICYYFTICEGIARGGKRFHLLPGRYEYKYRLLGEIRDISRVDIYRNRITAMRYAGRILRYTCTDAARSGKLWLLEAERRNDFSSRQAAKLVRVLRTLKRERLPTSVRQRTNGSGLGES